MHLLIILSHYLFTIIIYFQNQQKLSMPSSLSPSSSSTSMPIDMDLSDNESNLTSVSSPAPSLSESEKKFCYSERQPVLQPKIDSAFKKINSFEGNIHTYTTNR